MSKMQIKFYSSGFRQVLLSKGVKEALANEAERIRAKATANANGKAEFDAVVKYGKYGGGRWVAYIDAANKEAEQAEAENKALSRAVR